MKSNLNPCCLECINYADHITFREELDDNVIPCYGVKEYSAETTGHIHCFVQKEKTKEQNRLQRLKSKLEYLRHKIPELKKEEKELLNKIKELEKAIKQN